MRVRKLTQSIAVHPQDYEKIRVFAVLNQMTIPQTIELLVSSYKDADLKIETYELDQANE